MADGNVLKRLVQQYVDIEMIPAKITFFFTDGYFGAIMPYLNVFYLSLGLSPTHAGLISGISLLVASVFNPLWSTLADITGYRKLIFIIMCIGTGASVFSMPWVEQLVAKTTTNITCLHNITTNETRPDTCHTNRYLLNINTVFYTMLVFNIVAWVFFTSLRCYVDGTVTNVANTRATKKSYGPQRAISCLGYAIFSLIAGVLADHYRPSHMSSYTAIFYVFLPCVICMTPIGCILIDQAKWDATESKTSNKKRVYSQFMQLFKNADFLVFLLSVTVEGLILNIFNCFFFMLMEHEMHSTRTLMAFALLIGVISEIVMFTFASELIKILRGTIISLIVGIFSFFPRFMIMSYIVNPWYVLITQPLHALGMGLAWTAIVEHTYKIVSKDIKVSAVAMVSSMVFVATSAIANMVGGVVYELYGGRELFRYSGIIAGIWSVLMVLYYGLRHRLSYSKTHCTPAYPNGISQNIDSEENAA